MSRKPRRHLAPEAPYDLSTHPEGEHQDQIASPRHVRLEHVLLDELQGIIRDEATDPALAGVTLLSAHLSVDGGHARFAYAVSAPLRAEEERRRSSQAGLARAPGFLRARIARQLDLKKLPKLSFTFVGVAEEPPGAAVDPEDGEGGAP